VLQFREELDSVAETLSDYVGILDPPSLRHMIRTCEARWGVLLRESPELEADFLQLIAAVEAVAPQRTGFFGRSVSLDEEISVGSVAQVKVRFAPDRPRKAVPGFSEYSRELQRLWSSWLLALTHMEFTGERARAERRQAGISGRSVVWQPSALAELVNPPFDTLPRHLYDREAVLSGLKSRLGEPDGNIHLIFGPGGTGKSITALTVAENARNRGMKVWWVQGRTELIAACMTAVALQLKADMADIAEARSGRRSLSDLVWGRLENTRSPWLLVVDDVNDIETLNHLLAPGEEGSGWIRPSQAGMVIVTSRHSGETVNFRRMVRHKITSLKLESAVSFLQSSASGAGGTDDAEELARYLGCLPLACSIAARHIASSVTEARTFDGYLSELRDFSEGGIARIERDSEDSLLTASMRIIIRSMNRSENPEAWPLLAVLSYCAPGAPLASSVLDPDVFAEVGLSPWDIPREKRQSRLYESLDLLRSLGLTEPAAAPGESKSASPRAFRMHPLVSATCRAIVEDEQDVSADEQRRLWLAVATTLHRAARSHSEASNLNWADSYRLMPHVAALVGTLPSRSTADALQEAVLAAVVTMEHLYQTGAHHDAEQLGRAALTLSQSLPRDNAAALSITYTLARILMDRGQLGEAKELLQDVLDSRQRTLGLEHEASLDALELLASLQHRRGSLDQAEQMLRQVANGRQRSRGAASAERMRAMHALVRVLGEQGKLGEMERVNRDIISEALEHYGSEDRKTLSAESELGNTLRALGRLNDSEQVLQRVLALQTRLLGEDSPDVSNTLEELAATHRDQGRLGAAEQALKRVLTMRRRIFSQDDLDTVNTMAELAETLRRLARYDESEALFRKTVQSRARILGLDHPDTLNAQLGLAVILRDTGRFRESEKILQDTLAACRLSVGLDHPIALSASHNLAAVLQDTGRIGDAEQLYRDVLDRREWALGPNHPETLRTLVNLASLLHRRGSLDEAEHMLLQAEAAGSDIHRASHPNSLAIKNNLANVYLDSGRPSEALALYREVLEGQLANLGSGHPDTLAVRVNLAVALVGQGEIVAAEKLLQEAIRGFRSISKTADNPNLIAAEYQLARIAEQSGDLEAAYAGYLTIFALQDKSPSDISPDIITTQLSLSRVLERLGRIPEAESHFQQAIRRAARVTGRRRLIYQQHAPSPWIPRFGPPSK
jgi:tetratricopeptide (TPR) repeat protein